jgi:cytochrome P450
LAGEYWLRPARFFERCERLDDRFVIRMPGLRPMVCVTDPADVRAVFSRDQTALHFGEALKTLAPHELVLGSTSITVKDGEAHLRDRKMLAPHFGATALKSYEPGMAAKTREAMASWPMGAPVSFQSLMMQLTLEIIMGTIFGVTDPERLTRLRKAVIDFVAVIGGPGFFAFSIWAVARGGRWGGRHRRLRAAMSAVDAIVAEEMTLRRRSAVHDQPDILALLLRLQQEHGVEAMSDVAILEMIRTLLLAGYETTASTLGWIAERVTRHRNVLARLDESVAGGDDEYIDAVVAETMRLRPVAPFTSRLVVKPFDLDGLHLEPGVLLTPFIWLVHRRADVYPEPSAFQPERFVGRQPDTYAWIPFGGGLRKCLGGPFALLEMRTVLRTMLEQLRFVPTADADEPLGRRNVTIVPGRGATVVLERRHDCR